MFRRGLLALAAVVMLLPLPVAAQSLKPPAKSAADALDGPPIVSAKAWVVMDADTGKIARGGNEAEARPMASTTKIVGAGRRLAVGGTLPIGADHFALTVYRIGSNEPIVTLGIDRPIIAWGELSLDETLLSWGHRDGTVQTS